MIATTRRQLLARGGLAVGAATLPAAILAAPALAQEGEETDALEPLIDLEQAAELAYSLAAEEATGDAATLFRDLGSHAGEHATALAEALEQLGVEPEDASADPATYDSLGDFDVKSEEQELLAFFMSLEEDLILAYEDAVANLEAPDLVVSGAQIAASHAQALVALRLLDDVPPLALAKLPGSPTAPSAADGPGGDSQGN